jgi:hypothetical protein
VKFDGHAMLSPVVVGRQHCRDGGRLQALSLARRIDQ